MDDRTRHGGTFIDDEELDFDLGLADEEDADGGSRVTRVLKPGKTGPYKPARLRSTPNWSRIATALLVVAVFLFLLTAGIRAYLGHRTAEAYRAYFTDVRELTTQSDNQGQELSNLLIAPTGGDRAQLIGRIEKLSQAANKLTVEARRLEVPSEAVDANEWLVATLEYRRNGLVALQKAMTAGLRSTDQKAASAAVAAANARLVASDVMFADSFVALSRDTLRRQDVTGVRVPESRFVTDPEFASPKAMELMLGRITSAPTAAAGKAPGAFKPDGKVHGGQLTAVTISPSGETLSSSGVNEIAGSDDLAFEVTFQNQGEVQETQVPVVVTIGGDHSEQQQLKAVIDKVDPGQTASVRVPLADMPQFGEQLTVKVEVGPVPGEKKTENNSASYQVMFKL